jgi:hypothetical protein
MTFVAGLGLGAATVALVVVPRAPEAPARTAAVPAAAPMTSTQGAPSEAASVAAPAPAPAGISAPGLDAGPPAALPMPASDTASLPAAALETARLAPAGAPDPATASAAPAPVAEPPARAALPARATVHYPPSAGAEAEAAAAALREAGIGVETIPVGFAITRTNVRFYHEADQAAADAVVGLIAAGAVGEAPLARDFTDYATPPAPGKVEVWLAGAPPGVRPAPEDGPPATPLPVVEAPVVEAPVVSAPVAPAPVVPAAPEDQAEAVARIIVERAYERLMQDLPGD